ARVAMEMAAPDFEEIDAEFAVAESEVHTAEPPRAQVAVPPQVPVDEVPRPHVTEPPPGSPIQAASAPAPAVAQEPAPPVAPSLGATILATGLVTRPKTPANDPLAPIRRMTQAEKIAFFS